MMSGPCNTLCEMEQDIKDLKNEFTQSFSDLCSSMDQTFENNS